MFDDKKTTRTNWILNHLLVFVFSGDFLRILPWDKSPFFTTIWYEYVCDFFQPPSKLTKEFNHHPEPPTTGWLVVGYPEMKLFSPEHHYFPAIFISHKG